MGREGGHPMTGQAQPKANAAKSVVRNIDSLLDSLKDRWPVIVEMVGFSGAPIAEALGILNALWRAETELRRALRAAEDLSTKCSQIAAGSPDPEEIL